MSRIINFLRYHLPELILFLIILILCICNYTAGTFLSGWDNLHPEFNIWMNLKRSIFSLWQQYQGLGLLAGMAHAADLVRQLLILPFTLILPVDLIRYLWHFSMLFWGAFGLYNLVLYITKNKYSSLIASLFYLLNFATVQYFHLPFEPYSTFWGFFPWLIYTLLHYLDLPSRNSLKKLFLINLLATPSFYVQTLFVVYIICVSIILITHLFERSKSFHPKNYFTIYSTILFINAFWLLPNIFFTLTNVSVTQNSLQNLMVTDQFIEENLSRGNLQSFALLQGQYYDLKQKQGSSSQFIMQSWHQHLSLPYVIVISSLFISLALLALFSKNKYKKYFLLILFFGLIAFLANTFPFNIINLSLRHLPLINQIFRNSFTKLLVPTIFSLSVLLGITLSRIKKINYLFLPLLAILSWPSFFGNFISPKMRTNIPNQYFELFSYLNNTDSSKRILNLPQYNYWGWYDYQWSYTGSGFLWYGFENPITDRAFDVWDNHLENFYWQLHYALITRNPQYFQNLLHKYNLSYILFDPNVYFSESYNSSKVVLENQKLLDSTPNLKLVKEFGNLKLYEISPEKNNLVTFSTLPNLNVPTGYTYLDQAFLNYFHYQNTSKTTQTDTFPNNNLFSNHPNQNTSTLLTETSSLPWTTCTSSDPKLISATNLEQVTFYNCGDNLDLNQSYLIKINSQNLSGRPLLVKIFSLTDNRLIIDSRINPQEKTNYFVVPSIYPFDRGIGINLSSLSLSQNPSINQVNQVEISPYDWQNISNIHSNTPPTPVYPNLVNYHQYNQSFYRVTLNNNQQNNLVLFQSYSPYWVAFYFDRLKIKVLDHGQINNWANGWQLPTDQSSKELTVYILFWPQLLEFFGFILLLVPPIFFLKPQNHSLHNPW